MLLKDIKPRDLKRAARQILYELEREFRMRKLLISELNVAEGRIEIDLIQELLSTTKETIEKLERKHQRHAEAIRIYNEPDADLNNPLTPGDMQALRKHG